MRNQIPDSTVTPPNQSSEIQSQSRKATPRVGFLLLFVLMVAAAGCKHISQTVSPRVEGRVLDAHSLQPIKGVVVKRLSSTEELNVDQPQKGGQLLTPSDSARTSEAGVFSLTAVHDVAVFRHLSWYSVTLSFTHSSYASMKVTYTLDSATNNASGIPLVRAGDVLLVPKTQ
jgi:hypothetical protein